MSGIPGYRDMPTDDWDPAAGTDVHEAEEFIRLFHGEQSATAGPVAPRLMAVRAEIAATGSYVHTGPELQFGARVAWRNASRCIGRLYWNSLLVLDRRTSRTGDRIHSDIVSHLHIASGGGKPDGSPDDGSDRADGRAQMRPTISIFPAAVPGRPYARIWNEQLIRYAGYRNADGTVTGDPRYAEFTTAMTELGWSGKGEMFDVLPLAIETPTEGVHLYELPDTAVVEVPIGHPDHRWFDELGLRWHAVPAIANMRLTIGGVHYPCAPFNGWYMGAEIGARNLADTDRYNMLPIDRLTSRPRYDPRIIAVARPGARRAERRRALVVRAGRRADERSPHRVPAIHHAHRSRGACRPNGAGRLELDRATDLRRRHPGVPPLLPRK